MDLLKLNPSLNSAKLPIFEPAMDEGSIAKRNSNLVHYPNLKIASEDGTVPLSEVMNMTLPEFLQQFAYDQKADDDVWLEHQKNNPKVTKKGNKPVEALFGNLPSNLRDPITLAVDGDTLQNVTQSMFDVPFVVCGDLSGFDSDTTYPTPKGYVTLPPVQPPITPAYAEAVARRKRNVGKGQQRDLVKTFFMLFI